MRRAAEAFLKRHGLVRRIAVTVPTFSAAVLLAASSDLAAAVPRRVAQLFGTLAPIQVLELPVSSLRFTLELQWQERTHRDPACSYFRQLVIDAVAPRPRRR